MSVLAIIVPTLNEARLLPLTLRRVREAWADALCIVADGGSTDATVALARQQGAAVIDSPSGRGRQLHAGALITDREWMLFLHADTQVDAAAARAADAYMAKPAARIATFQLRFDQPHWFLRGSAWFTRFDTVFTRFGDQGILVRSDVYRALGGFRPWPLFEDVDLLRRARREGPVDVLPATVTTSARRFTAHGHVRQQLRNAWLLARFLAGADPANLARSYQPTSLHETTPSCSALSGAARPARRQRD